MVPVLRPDAAVVTSPLAVRGTPAKVGLVAGRRYRVSDLFRAMLLVSANDAEIALAQATGSYRRGVAMMNAEARHLRADDTEARRPDRRSRRGQRSSAYDLALLARRALAIPALMRIEAERTATFLLGRRHSVTLYNQNTMLASYPWRPRRQDRPAAARPRPRPPHHGAEAARGRPGGGDAGPGARGRHDGGRAGVLLALLVAGGIALAVRRPPRAGSPPGP